MSEHRAKIKRLEKENAYLLKVCGKQFTFNTTTNKKFSIFNLVRKEFAERLKHVIHERDYLQGYAEIGLIEEIDELLKEYERWQTSLRIDLPVVNHADITGKPALGVVNEANATTVLIVKRLSIA